MTTIVIAIYAVLIIGFLVMSALIFRHTVKYSYLSTRFKVTVSIFGILALIVLIFSIFLIFQMDGEPKSPSFTPSTPSDVEIQF